MLTFFRKIRRSLLDSGRLKRYFVYAIGEIALIVVGILIAVQINNWNEWRKDRIVEKQILNDLADNIQRNIVILTDGINVLEKQNTSSQIILKALKSKDAYSDSLQLHFWNATLRGTQRGIVSSEGYESYKNAGFNLVQSEELKNEIIRLFEVVYKDAHELMLLYRGSTNYIPLWSKAFVATDRY